MLLGLEFEAGTALLVKQKKNIKIIMSTEVQLFHPVNITQEINGIGNAYLFYLKTHYIFLKWFSPHNLNLSEQFSDSSITATPTCPLTWEIEVLPNVILSLHLLSACPASPKQILPLWHSPSGCNSLIPAPMNLTFLLCHRTYSCPACS